MSTGAASAHRLCVFRCVVPMAAPMNIEGCGIVWASRLAVVMRMVRLVMSRAPVLEKKGVAMHLYWNRALPLVGWRPLVRTRYWSWCLNNRVLLAQNRRTRARLPCGVTPVSVRFVCTSHQVTVEYYSCLLSE